MSLELPAIARIAAALAVALLISFVATPIVKALAQRMGAVDVPKDNRRMHDHPIPRMGGLAIFLGFLLSTLVFVPMSQSLKGMLLGAAAGAAADLALHTNTVKKTAAGKAMQTATDAVDAAAASVKETMNR